MPKAGRRRFACDRRLERFPSREPVRKKWIPATTIIQPVRKMNLIFNQRWTSSLSPPSTHGRVGHSSVE